MINYKGLIVLFLLIAGSYGISYAQCCSAGNPISTDGGSAGLQKGAFGISVLYKGSTSDTYYHGSKEIDFVNKESLFHFTSLNIEYGLTQRWALVGNIGYFVRKSEVFPEFDYERYASGLGDASIQLKHQLISQPTHKFALSLIGTVKIPVGAKEVEYDGVILPIDFQPSTGSSRYSIATALSKGIGSDLSLFGYASYEYINAIETSSATYKYGDIVVGALGANYRVGNGISANLQSRYEWRDKRVDNETEVRESTGGSVLYMVPQISYTNKSAYNVALSFDVPVYRYMNFIENGTGQLGNKFMFSIKVSKTINSLFEPKTLSFDELEVLNESQFFVDGICAMCKERIEQLAMKQKNVKWAEWNMETKQLKYKFKDEVDAEKLMKLMAKTGHDTEKIKASDQAYNALHGCCKYRSESKE
jgi:periplasmic mercuric ion binding protein